MRALIMFLVRERERERAGPEVRKCTDEMRTMHESQCPARTLRPDATEHSACDAAPRPVCEGPRTRVFPGPRIYRSSSRIKHADPGFALLASRLVVDCASFCVFSKLTKILLDLARGNMYPIVMELKNSVLVSGLFELYYFKNKIEKKAENSSLFIGDSDLIDKSLN